MKKRTIWIICTAVIVVALAGMLAFVLGGNKPKNLSISMDGNWMVVANINEGELTLIDNEYMVFENNTVKDYRDNSTDPYAQSTYSIDADVLALKDISRTYHISVKSDNVVALYTNERTYMTLVKTELTPDEQTTFNAAEMSGRWDVIYRNSDQPVDEYFVFDFPVLQDFRNGETKPNITAEYYWNENHIVVDAIGKDMVLRVISNNHVVLVEVDTGYVWELQKIG